MFGEVVVIKKSASPVYSSDMMMMYCVFPPPGSVISMSVLYVLTLHHRGDITEKDGYVLFRETLQLYSERNQFSFSS